MTDRSSFEAKPEPKFKTCDDTKVVSNGTSTIPCACKVFDHSCPKCCTPVVDKTAKPLTESVDEWIAQNKLPKRERNLNIVIETDVISAYCVSDYLTALHSQHQAELELLRSKLALVLRENRRLSDELKKVDAELAAAREQGRREAIDECVSEAASTYAKECNAVFDRWVDAEIKPAREEAARQTEPAQEKL